MGLVTNAAMEWSVQFHRPSVPKDSQALEAATALVTNAAMEWSVRFHRLSAPKDLRAWEVVTELATSVSMEKYVPSPHSIAKRI